MVVPHRREPLPVSFRWATVVEIADGLMVRLDGESEPLPFVIDTLVSNVIPGDRVWCQFHGTRIIALGRGGGSESGGGGPTDPDNYYTKPQVNQLLAAIVQDKHYLHRQEAPSKVWSVVHNLGKRPSVSITDAGGAVVYGNVEYPDDKTCSVSFDFAITGTAVCN